ncbi:ribose-phosphate diphosphokinase [Candidatus Woesearchaeota archaeon]|jgi:ribose-phosphate pyrophosphokinase|nr:ribose-phosphate diphosphokinase [Candidatus Woesearchaeota archaeon]
MKQTKNEMAQNGNSIEIVAGREMGDLAKNVFDQLKDQGNFNYSKVDCTVFANKEMKPKLPGATRHKDVYLFHSMYHPDPNSSLVELLLTADAISRSSADSITLVLPYMSYLRQDRKDEPHVPISARLVADLIQANPKVERVLTMDLHSDQAQGFYQIPVDNLYGSLVHAEYFKEKFQSDYENLVVVSPDHGGVVRARRFAKSLDESVPVYIIDKRRTGANQCEVMNFIGGDISGKDIVIYDDMIDTGGSIVAAANVAKEKGARNVYACVSHGLFSAKEGAQKSTEQKFAESGLEVVVAGTIPRSNEYLEKNASWLTVLPIDKLLSRAVYESSKPGGSVSSLFYSGGEK